MLNIIDKITRELKQNIDRAYGNGEKKFFKEPIKAFGVPLPQRRKIASQFWPEVKQLTKQEIFQLSETMFKTDYNEHASIASTWIYKIKNQFTRADFLVFQRWVGKYLDNWAKIDDFCTHSLGYLINCYPYLAKKLRAWTKSSNRWVRRASAVSLIHPFGKKKRFLPEIFQVAEQLLTDPDDLVQKGYGWMLKEASQHNQKQVFKFVMKHKTKMPRTALRYAIEKMPLQLKRKAMEK